MANVVTRTYDAVVSAIKSAASTVVGFVNEKVLGRTVAVDSTSEFSMAVAADTPPGQAKGRSVNLFTEGWTSISGTTRIPRYQFGITFVWTDYAGVDHECQRTLIFPDALVSLPLEVIQDRVQGWLIEIARAECGVDE